jgi:hypothetical protein
VQNLKYQLDFKELNDALNEEIKIFNDYRVN